MNFDAFRYRIYFAVRGVGSDVLRRVPAASRGAKRLSHALFPEAAKWVRVRFGISKGLWMRLLLPREVRIWRGEHEVTVQRAILAVVTPGCVVFDVGAHTGSIALGVARLVGPMGRVVAFEADPQNVNTLKENAARNQLSCLQFVSSAVWSYSAPDISFRQGGAHTTHGGVESDGQRAVMSSGEIVKVSAVSLDDFVTNGGPIPALVKVDVEGGEYEVLRGGTKLFAEKRPLLVAEVHHQEASDQIKVWLTQHRYSSRWIVPQEMFPSCLFGWPEEYDGAAWMRRIDDPNK
jgi:FkbM family methyltransferase